MKNYPLTEVPAWCYLNPIEHQDGLGGCWGISHGEVARLGEEHCKKCEYHRDNIVPAPVQPNDVP